ncbi:hypothetical protein QUB10_12910 [Microcoleus sp. B5-D4]|uniref:hypothetical protein n=1 Tax=unclassified Microcoleus TaxID=2642155 RepID=UPI002FD769FB
MDTTISIGYSISAARAMRAARIRSGRYFRMASASAADSCSRVVDCMSLVFRWDLNVVGRLSCSVNNGF